jgi:hypothetical protein
MEGMMKCVVWVMVAFCWASVSFAESKTPEALPSRTELGRPLDAQDQQAFQQPSQVFRPETWFHFIGGNVASKGITADLEAIHGAGISGIQLFHGQFGGAWPGVEPQIKCLSPSWDAQVRHVAEQCRRLGLRFTMQNCPGWAMSGGPWITPGNAMRHLVWSRTDVVGDKAVTVTLPMPQPSKEEWRDYREVAVVAFPTPAGDTGKALVPASVRSNQEKKPWAACLGSDRGPKIALEPGPEPVWVEATFPDTVTVRTVQFPSVQSFSHPWCYAPGVKVTVEAITPDGPHEVARLDMPPSNWQDRLPISVACAEVPAKTYRIRIEHRHKMVLGPIRLFTGARQNNWEAEAAWVLRGLDRRPYPQQSKATWVDPAGITDLTGKMDPQGQLVWNAPAGNWTVLRMGHVNTGRKNGPAPPEATGWECDKLSPVGAEMHFAGYIGRLSGQSGPVGGGLLTGMLMDSWECETQTWTPGMDAQFERLRGYRLAPWLPALVGYTVGDPERTTRFLRDWRATVNDLVVKNYFGRMAELGHQRGLTVSFETASGDVFPGDILEYYKHADVPMCEFWQPRTEDFVGSLDFKPIKPCASAARMYGKPRVAAEAFTSFKLTFDEHPGMLKDVANIHFVEGVTHLVFHTYTHAPRTDWLPPSTSFGSGIGTPFLRGQTWWKHMPEFTAYLARCGYLLERGHPVSDVLWYLGDEQDHKPHQEAPFPAGYKYDYCNPDALLNRLAVRDGQIVTPEGIAYRLVWLKQCPRMLPETLEKTLTLVEQGATVVGQRPQGLATLSGGAKAENRFQQAVRRLWGDSSAPGVREVGRGRVISGLTLDEALRRIGVEPDVTGEGPMWTHRRTADADWYFVAAHADQGFRGELGFRAHGVVELWDPVTGKTMAAPAVRRQSARTRVTLDLPPSGSVFVVFRKTGPAAAPAVASSAVPARSLQIGGPWTLSFPAGWDVPSAVKLDTLRPWMDLEGSPAAKAFSGTATYTTEFTLDAFAPNSRAELDLGQVEVIAAVKVNGCAVGTVWSPPYRVDISQAVKAGVNRLSVEVTSTWYNRLAYDAGLPEPQRKTWTIKGPAKGSPFKPSGLLGPVTVTVK